MTDQATTETGDYKPKNIFLTGGAGKLLDGGVGRILINIQPHSRFSS